MKRALRHWRRQRDASQAHHASRLLADTRGLTTVEYMLLFVVIAVGTVVLWVDFGAALAGLFGDDVATQGNHSANRSSSAGGTSSGSSQPTATSPLPSLGGVGSLSLGAKDDDSSKPSFASRAWEATKSAVGETVDLVAGGVVGVVPFASLTNPAPPFGNQREFGQGMMVTSGAMMVAEAGAMLGDGAVTVGSGGTAAAVTVPVAVGIATAAAGSVINWQNGAKLAQNTGITASSGSGSSGSGSTSGVSSGAADNTSPAGITKRPKGFRKKTVQDAWKDADPGTKPASKACPTCKKDVEVAPGQGPRDWDLDHQPPWSQRDLSGKTRKEVLDEYNQGTRLECPGCNRGRGAKPAR
jgi:filamentous hemagglutinin